MTLTAMSHVLITPIRGEACDASDHISYLEMMHVMLTAMSHDLITSIRYDACDVYSYFSSFDNAHQR